MYAIRHVCQSGAAAELVRRVSGADVVEVSDDYAIGPLVDVDSSSPDARVAFWSGIFALDKQMRSVNWSTELRAANKALGNLSRETTEVVIWAGSHPTEQTMRRRVHWWLKDSPLLVSEVLVGAHDVANPDRCIHAPIALVSSERLRACFERRSTSTADEREKLATEWAALRESGCGLRVWEGGALSERRIDHYDAKMLSLVQTGPTRFVEVLSQAMADTGNSDAFCKWRFATLLQTGEISLVHGSFNDVYSAIVRRGESTDNTQCIF